MLSRKALILLFRLFRYRFSIRLCELFWRLQMGDADLPREVSDGWFLPFPVRNVNFGFDFLVSTSWSTSHGELDSELLGDEAKLGAEMEGLLHGAVGVEPLFSKAVGMSQGSTNDF